MSVRPVDNDREGRLDHICNCDECWLRLFFAGSSIHGRHSVPHSMVTTAYSAAGVGDDCGALPASNKSNDPKCASVRRPCRGWPSPQRELIYVNDRLQAASLLSTLSRGCARQVWRNGSLSHRGCRWCSCVISHLTISD